MTDLEDRSLVGLDPADGDERWRHGLDEADTQSQVGTAALLARTSRAPRTPRRRRRAAPSTSTGSRSSREVSRAPAQAGRGGRSPSRVSRCSPSSASTDSVYAYVSTPGADGTAAGSIVKLDAADGSQLLADGLPETVAVAGETATIDANGDAVVVAGGEKIASPRRRRRRPPVERERGHAGQEPRLRPARARSSEVAVSATPSCSCRPRRRADRGGGRPAPPRRVFPPRRAGMERRIGWAPWSSRRPSAAHDRPMHADHASDDDTARLQVRHLGAGTAGPDR